jgi:hypothetical protein
MKTFKVYEISKQEAINENIWNQWLSNDLPVLKMKVNQFNYDLYWHQVELAKVKDVVELKVKKLEHNDFTYESLKNEEIKISKFLEEFANRYKFNK